MRPTWAVASWSSWRTSRAWPGPKPWSGCVTGGCWMAPGQTQGVGRAVPRAGVAYRYTGAQKNALRGSQRNVETPIRPKSGMLALIGPSRCGSGPARSQRPQTIRRADGWPGVVCGGLASHCRRPSAGWQRLAPRLAQSWRPLLHRARADCPASSSSTSTPTDSQPSTSPAPTGWRSGPSAKWPGRCASWACRGTAASTWPKGWPTPWPWPHGYPGTPSAWAGRRDSTTSSSPAGWLAQGPSTFGLTSTRQGSRPPKSWAAW